MTRPTIDGARGLPAPDRRLPPASTPAVNESAVPHAATPAGPDIGLRRRETGVDAEPNRFRSALPPAAGAAPGATPTQVESALERMHWHPGVGPQPPQRQLDLEREYVHWANDVLAQRQAQFEQPYRVDASMSASWREALLPAAVEAIKGSLSAAPRGASRNALATALDPSRGELSFQYDAVTLAGVLGGAVAYLSDAWLVSAVDRRAAAGNLAEVVPVDVGALIPAPCPVKLIVENGAKRYERMGHEERAAAVESADKSRAALQRWQAGLASKGVVSAFAPPLLSGAIGVARRTLSSAANLVDPATIFWTSAMSSAMASVIHKPMWTMLQVAPGVSQTTAPDLVGGSQKLPLYNVHLPDAEQPGATIRDLPAGVVKTVREAAALAAHSLDVRRGGADLYQQYKDASRLVAAGTWSSIGATAIGIFLAQIKRGGALVPLKGEDAHSGANLLQQFGQSGTQSFLWGAFKDAMDVVKYPLGESLDAHRDKRMGRLTDRAEHAVERANALISRVDEVDRAALRLGRIAQHLGADEPTLEGVHRALVIAEDVIALSNPAMPAPARVADIHAALTRAAAALQERQRLADWRGAAPSAVLPSSRAHSPGTHQDV